MYVCGGGGEGGERDGGGKQGCKAGQPSKTKHDNTINRSKTDQHKTQDQREIDKTEATKIYAKTQR